MDAGRAEIAPCRVPSRCPIFVELTRTSHEIDLIASPFFAASGRRRRAAERAEAHTLPDDQAMRQRRGNRAGLAPVQDTEQQLDGPAPDIRHRLTTGGARRIDIARHLELVQSNHPPPCRRRYQPRTWPPTLTQP